MKIKIIECKKPTFWYHNHIEEEYEVIRAVTYPNNHGKGFEVKGKRYVDIDDCVIIFEQW